VSSSFAFWIALACEVDIHGKNVEVYPPLTSAEKERGRVFLHSGGVHFNCIGDLVFPDRTSNGKKSLMMVCSPNGTTNPAVLPACENRTCGDKLIMIVVCAES